jgi:DNA-binding MarR family transcriptional regulator
MKTERSGWTFLTNHSHVLVCLDRDPEVRLRDVAEVVGITERATQRIVKELEEAGAISHQRVGRRNVYTVNKSLGFRHSLEAHRSIGDLLALLSTD